MGRARASRFVVALSIAMAACASDFERRFAEADELRLEAAAQGYEWLGTAALLDDARTHAERGDVEAALVLVDKARFQAEAALLQAEREQEAWQGRVVK
jgi:hypothetical protein